MIELAFKGRKSYWGWIVALLVIIGGAFGIYLGQIKLGLGITGMSRDVSWGFYIANFTYLVGVAAGGVMVVLPYYLHNVKEFGKITILGEFLAVAAVNMCLMFILVDLGHGAFAPGQVYVAASRVPSLQGLRLAWKRLRGVEGLGGGDVGHAQAERGGDAYFRRGDLANHLTAYVKQFI